MLCAICRQERKHFWAVGVNVCDICAANLVTLVVRDTQYKQLLMQTAVMTYRQELEAIDEPIHPDAT